MESLEAELERARALETADLADAIETIGFECTRCGACCKSATGCDTGAGAAEASDESGVEAGDESGVEAGDESGVEASDEATAKTGGETSAETDDEEALSGASEEAHTATVFPDEVRQLQDATGYDWRDVARPTPYGLVDGPGGPTGETFEWALQTDACGDCTFYEETAGTGACTVHADRPLICQTYPFSVALGGTSQPMGEAVDEEGVVRAHECEGLGRDISRVDAEALAATLRQRAVRELEEAIAVRDGYEPADVDGVVVHDSEGAKRPDGTPLGRDG